MSARLSAELTVLNVVRLDGVPKSNMRLKQVEQMLTKIAEEEGDKLVQEVKGKNKSTYNFQGDQGSHSFGSGKAVHSEKLYEPDYHGKSGCLAFEKNKPGRDNGWCHRLSDNAGNGYPEVC